MQLFITCPKTLEEILSEELKELGFTNTRIGYAGVYVEVESFKDIYTINYLSRIASRVLLPLKKFKVRDAKDLYDGVREIQWSPYFKKLANGQMETMAVDANVDHPKLTNSLFAAQVVKDAVCDQLIEICGIRPSVNTISPDVQLNLFIWGGEATVSFDTSGEPLHKRGYRKESVEAPLRENLAAALLRLSNYKPSDVMIDPCAGSATLLIEAAWIASNTPPGTLRRQWGFQRSPEYRDDEWQEVKQQADQKKIALQKDHFFGCEVNKNAYRIALSQFKTLGLAPFITLYHGTFQSYEPPISPTFLLTNPPYGVRMEEEEHLKSLYRDLGHFMKRKMAKPSFANVITGSIPLSKEVGLAAHRRIPVNNGGVEARLLQFEIR